MDKNLIDVKENYIYHLDNGLLEILLKDRSSGGNIIWATDNYASRGVGFQSKDQITIQAITGYNGSIIKPRVEKSKKEQDQRIKQKAEVFTPSWICNKQNNLVDNAWFGEDFVFNVEQDKTWISTKEPVHFPTPTGKTWQDYVLDTRLEITCGEAPYLVSRYDAVTGEQIALESRIGLLDRKLRVVSENTADEKDWLKWATAAYQNIYGFDWQGDNVLLARENLLFTFIDYYAAFFNRLPAIETLRSIAVILSWNVWQMDGLKFVIPESCHSEKDAFTDLLGKLHVTEEPCPGCKMNKYNLHNGIYCYIMDWGTGKKVKFDSLLKGK